MWLKKTMWITRERKSSMHLVTLTICFVNLTYDKNSVFSVGKGELALAFPEKHTRRIVTCSWPRESLDHTTSRGMNRANRWFGDYGLVLLLSSARIRHTGTFSRFWTRQEGWLVLDDRVLVRSSSWGWHYVLSSSLQIPHRQRRQLGLLCTPFVWLSASVEALLCRLPILETGVSFFSHVKRLCQIVCRRSCRWTMPSSVCAWFWR